MKAVVIHAAKDLRVEDREAEAVAAGQVEVAIEAGGICGRTCTITTTAASELYASASR